MIHSNKFLMNFITTFNWKTSKFQNFVQRNVVFFQYNVLNQYCARWYFNVWLCKGIDIRTTTEAISARTVFAVNSHPHSLLCPLISSPQSRPAFYVQMKCVGSFWWSCRNSYELLIFIFSKSPYLSMQKYVHMYIHFILFINLNLICTHNRIIIPFVAAYIIHMLMYIYKL